MLKSVVKYRFHAAIIGLSTTNSFLTMLNANEFAFSVQIQVKHDRKSLADFQHTKYVENGRRTTKRCQEGKVSV